MRRDLTIKTASLAGASDLTIVAPIKKGFVPSLDAVTYKTRVERVLKTLHAGRTNAYEYELARVLSDAVERVGRIHSIRIAILEPEDKVMLAVTFDGSWESYIRVIWQKVARSLDLIFCNTEGYPIGWDSTFEKWCTWLRGAQAETSFLYSPPGLTYQDTQYLRSYERHRRQEIPSAQTELAVTRMRIRTAEEISEQIADDAIDPTNLGLGTALDPVSAGRPAFRQGMRGLAGLYRLAEWHLPGTEDGAVLHRAASELLREFTLLLQTPSKVQSGLMRANLRFKDALDWLRDTPQSDRPVPDLPDAPPADVFADVQGGIIEAYPAAFHGCLLLLAFDTPLALASFLEAARPTNAADPIGTDHMAVNVALTSEGLRLAGLTDDEMAALPEEFVQGMERRAGVLGDVRANHPRRWRRPGLNWEQGIAAPDLAEEDPSPRVDLSAVHLVLQLRLCNSSLAPQDARASILSAADALVQDARKHVMRSDKTIAAAEAGVRPLSLQWMHRLTAEGKTREHFGFLDSESGPVFKKTEAGKKYPNHTHLGEVLMGHDNAADAAPSEESRTPAQELLRNGSFLVVRKLRQDVEELELVLNAGVGKIPMGAAAGQNQDPRHTLLAKMMGRWPAVSATPGEPLVASTAGNDFNFNRDVQGTACPFHAHIRLANPRDTSAPEPPGARPARIVRRGLSYGPAHDSNLQDAQAHADSLKQERGLVFMAYNASIGEQFEVIQRWLTGGNSSGSYSGQSDPFLGVAEPGRQRHFRFEHGGQSVSVALDGSDRMHDEPRPIVRLEWGMYLFTPSIPSLVKLAERAKVAGRFVARSWSIDQGETAIAELRQIEQAQGPQAAFDAWKAAIEDPASAGEFKAASIWAAIRANHGGVLRSPFGILVASRELVDEVLLDKERHLTATGYLPRMHRSFGPLYLGMDAGQIDGTYERESAAVNAAIMGLTPDRAAFDKAVEAAAEVTRKAIDQLAKDAADYAVEDGETRWEVSFEAREIIEKLLAHFCEKWFGLSEEGDLLQKGGVRWTWLPGEPPRYPGHFMAPSRYTFQPHPGPEVERIGAAHGLALRTAVTQFLQTFGGASTAPVARAVLDSDAARTDSTYPARTLAGVLMGFLPTTDGNMRRVLNEWLNEGTLWLFRAQHDALAPSDQEGARQLAKQIWKKIVSAMQLRAAPELLWRTVAVGHKIGEVPSHQVDVRAGEIVIASLISATQQCLEEGDPRLTHAFGGDRSANGHPTHACPGYGPALAVLFGFIHGLIQSGQALRPGPGPLAFSMEGYVALRQDVRESLLLARDAQPADLVALEAGMDASTTRLLMIGDSWLTDHGDFFLAPPSLASSLRRLGYQVDAEDKDKSFEFRGVGMPLSQLTTKAKLKEIGQYLADADDPDVAPKAILIGGGGNDLVDPPDQPEKSPLFGLLNATATTAATALIEDRVQAFIDQTLFDRYKKLLDVVTLAAAPNIPILLHGYDHPIPDGRKYEGLFFGFGQSGPWLKPIFKEKKFTQLLAVRQEVMMLLIERLNSMLIRVAGEYPGRVHHVQLNGVLAAPPRDMEDYTRYWDNELHPTRDGYDILAAVVEAELIRLGVN